MRTVLNIIWLLLCGIWMALGYVVGLVRRPDAGAPSVSIGTRRTSATRPGLGERHSRLSPLTGDVAAGAGDHAGGDDARVRP